MRNKIKLTEELIKQLPDELKVPLSSARVAWWYNIRPDGGMRLTASGFNTLANTIGLDYYKFSIENPLSFTQYTILKLDRKLNDPYFIEYSKGVPQAIQFFGSKEAVLITLYGNLDNFLDNYN